jgi:hypothetical protein
MFQVDGTMPRLVPTAHDAASGNTVLNPGPCLRSAEMIKKINRKKRGAKEKKKY